MHSETIKLPWRYLQGWRNCKLSSFLILAPNALAGFVVWRDPLASR